MSRATSNRATVRVRDAARLAGVAPLLAGSLVICAAVGPREARAQPASVPVGTWDPAAAAAYLDRRIDWWMSSYCHPQADAIERAFSGMANRHQLVTEGGHSDTRFADDPKSVSVND